MASTPKRRRTLTSSQQPSSFIQENQIDDISQLVDACIAADIPLVQETVRQCILSLKQQETPTIA